jgi:hypothetical protein
MPARSQRGGDGTAHLAVRAGDEDLHGNSPYE